MNLIDLLGLQHARTVALIGAGGKTTLLWLLANEARARGERVLVTTSTHIMQPDASQCDRFLSPLSAQELSHALACGGVTCAGYPNAAGKCTGLSPDLFAAAQLHADRIFYEADGAARLPLKLHRTDEPVLHPETDAVVILLGLSSFGRPVQEVVHRWTLSKTYASFPQRPVGDADLLALAREAAAAAGLGPARTRIILNQADTPLLRAHAADLMRVLSDDGWSVWMLSLKHPSAL